MLNMSLLNDLFNTYFSPEKMFSLAAILISVCVIMQIVCNGYLRLAYVHYSYPLAQSITFSKIPFKFVVGLYPMNSRIFERSGILFCMSSNPSSYALSYGI